MARVPFMWQEEKRSDRLAVGKVVGGGELLLWEALLLNCQKQEREELGQRGVGYPQGVRERVRWEPGARSPA